MTAVLLFFTVCVTLGFLGWSMYEARQERLQLINRIIGKTAGEVRVLDSRDTDEWLPPRPAMTDEEFDFLEHGDPIGL